MTREVASWDDGLLVLRQMRAHPSHGRFLPQRTRSARRDPRDISVDACIRSQASISWLPQIVPRRADRRGGRMDWVAAGCVTGILDSPPALHVTSQSVLDS
jgi:hypothetical protein